jgi:ABC-type hemin transport system substrate-binding protein
MDDVEKYADADKFSLLEDDFVMDIGAVSTDETIRLGEGDNVISVKNTSEEPIRVVPKDNRTIIVLAQNKVV